MLFVEVASGFEPLYEVLQTSAQPLGHATNNWNANLRKIFASTNVIGEFSLVFLEGFSIGFVVQIVVGEGHKFGKAKPSKLAARKIVYL